MLDQRITLLKTLYHLERIEGKFFFQKTIFALKYFGTKDLTYDFQRHFFGPFSFDLGDELDYLEEEGYLIINRGAGNDIIANKKKIKKKFDEKGYSIRLKRKLGKNIYKIEDLFLKLGREKILIELAFSILQIINEGEFNLKEEVIRELKEWKENKFNNDQIEFVWDILISEKCLPEVVIYLNRLLNLESGKKHAHQYHKIASKIVAWVFKDSLTQMDSESETHKGLKRIDTIYNNSAKSGFFHDLHYKKGIKCSYIILEAKNYSNDPDNPEFDQLAGRLNKKTSSFGILICRNIEDKSKVLERTQTYLDDDKYILYFTDEDLIKLVSLARRNLYAEVDDFLEKRFKALIFRK